MAETLLQKAQRLGIKPTGASKMSTTNSLLLRAQQAGIKPASQTEGAEPTSFAEKLVQTKTNETGLKGFATGFTKGILGTITGLGQLTSKGLSYLPGKAGEFFKGGGEYGKELQEGLLKPSTTSEKVGKTTEQVAEFFIPASKAAKAEKSINLMIDGFTKFGTLGKSLAKIGTSATIGGLTTGAVTAAQTGDLKKGAEAAKYGAIVSGGLRAVGETIKALKIPQLAYNRIFKENYQNLKNEWRPEVIASIKKTNPVLYKEYIKNGVFKEINGKTILNDDMVQKALERGLKGSPKNMTKELISDNFSLENDILKAMKDKKVSFVFNPTGEHKNLFKVLTDISSDYADVGNGEIANEAKKYAAFVGKGKVPGGVMLEMRRFLDGMRIKSSYTPTAKLSMGQESLKYWTDSLRDKIAKFVPSVGGAMKDYSFNIKAIDSLAKFAARTGNKEVLGLIDSVFLGSAAMGEPTIATVGLLRKVLQSPRLGTALAQEVVRAPSATGMGIKTAISSGLSKLTQ